MLPRQTANLDISDAGSTACAEFERLFPAADSADFAGFSADTLVDKRQLAELSEKQPKSGVYFLWLRGELQYIGSSAAMNSRIYMHYTAMRYGNPWGGYPQCIRFDRVTYYAYPDCDEMREIERDLIGRFNPPINCLGRTDLEPKPKRRRPKASGESL